MQRLLAIALVVCCAASAHAQRIAAPGATSRFTGPGSVTVAAPVPSITRPMAWAQTSVSTAAVSDGQHGSVWVWMAVGTLVGGVVGGSIMNTRCSRDPGSCAEFSISLATVLGGIGGGFVGAVTHRISQGKLDRSTPSGVSTVASFRADVRAFVTDAGVRIHSTR